MTSYPESLTYHTTSPWLTIRLQLGEGLNLAGVCPGQSQDPQSPRHLYRSTVRTAWSQPGALSGAGGEYLDS